MPATGTAIIEEQQLVKGLALAEVPFVVGVAVQEDVFNDVAPPNLIGAFDVVFEIDRSIVADGEGPVACGTAKESPDAVNDKKSHISFGRKQGTLKKKEVA